MQPVDAQDVVAKAKAPKQEQAMAASATPAATADNKPADFLVVSPTYTAKAEQAVQQAPARNPREDADAAARVIATAAKAFPGQPV